MQTNETTPSKSPVARNTKPVATSSKRPATGIAPDAKTQAQSTDTKPDAKNASGLIPLKRILAELSLPADGKAARRKLRKLWRTADGAKQLPHELRTAWAFTEAQADIARGILKAKQA